MPEALKPLPTQPTSQGTTSTTTTTQTTRLPGIDSTQIIDASPNMIKENDRRIHKK